VPAIPSTLKAPLELNPAVESTVSVVFRSVSSWAPLTFATPHAGVGFAEANSLW